jgi:hypothetical protein
MMSFPSDLTCFSQMVPLPQQPSSVLEAIGYPWSDDEDDDTNLSPADNEERLRKFALQSMSRPPKKERTEIHVFTNRHCKYGEGVLHLLHHRPNRSEEDQIYIQYGNHMNEIQELIQTGFPNYVFPKDDVWTIPFVVLKTSSSTSYFTCQDIITQLS